MERKEFVRAIEACRFRVNLAGFLGKLAAALCVGAAAGIFFQTVSFVVPFYYAGLYTILALVLAVLTASVAAYAGRTGMEQAALVMDSFGFDERIVTAYGNLEKEGAMVELQRADAMRQLQAHPDKIRITLLPPWKRIGSLAALFAALLVLSLLPSETKERAEEAHSVREEAKEKEEEIEELVEALEQLEQEELAPEQQALLQEMIESLQASQAEYQQAASSDMVRAATEKLNYRYEDMGSQLAGLAQSLQNGAAVSSVTAESLQALAEKMQGMGGTQLAQGTAGQSGDKGSNGKNGQNGNGGQNGQGANGQNANGQNGGSGQNGQNGQSGNSGGGDGDGDGDGGGDGDSDSNGGSGQSGDSGSGRGTGTGTSSTPHDYVSIPNDIADSGNLTGNAVDHDASEYFRGQNGLSWEGTHMSHEAVIGSYEQNAYEGIAAGKYPSGMEEIIKAYFSNFD